jgi:hypothetical protein
LVISDGLLVRASRPALYFKHLISSVAIDVLAPTTFRPQKWFGRLYIAISPS